MGPNDEQPKVLVVDDDPANLDVFEANFEDHLDIRTAASGREALEILEREEFPVVISDQRMPAMTGAELLAEVRRRWPETIRILITAYSNFEDAVAAINQGQVAHFIRKPWEPQGVLGTIVSANNLFWTERENRALREQLIHSERLSAVGKLTSGLVHELANIGTIFNAVHQGFEEILGSEDPPAELDLFGQGLAKFVVLTESLRLFSKGDEDLRVECSVGDVGAMVAETMALCPLFPRCKALAEISFSAPDEPIVGAVDIKKLQQVVLNLVKNAAEACPPGTGKVVVSLGLRGDQALLEVRDNGPGISAEVAGRIWRGFYTTKGRQGTGLGLWMCRRIVEAHGGSITFENLAEGGCRFEVALPLRPTLSEAARDTNSSRLRL